MGATEVITVSRQQIIIPKADSLTSMNLLYSMQSVMKSRELLTEVVGNVLSFHFLGDER